MNSKAPDIFDLAGLDSVFQFDRVYNANKNLAPERALQLATFHDGVFTLAQAAVRKPRTMRERMDLAIEREWLDADDWEWPFSFNNCVEALFPTSTPQAIRTALKRNPRAVWARLQGKSKKAVGMRQQAIG